MNKRNIITNTMMLEMCMWICRMCINFRTFLSDVLSISRVNPCAAQTSAE